MYIIGGPIKICICVGGLFFPPLTSMSSIQITRICLYTCIFIYSVCALSLPENFSHTIPFFYNLYSIHTKI